VPKRILTEEYKKSDAGLRILIFNTFKTTELTSDLKQQLTIQKSVTD